MTNKPGRPPMYGEKLIRRIYQITAAHDRLIKDFAHKNKLSEAAVLRDIIANYPFK